MSTIRMQARPLAAPTTAALSHPKPDAGEIAHAVQVLHASDAVIELRALFVNGRKRTDAGYFDDEHRDDLIREAMRLNSAGAAVYVTLNPIDPQLLARYANRVQEYAQATATDANVTCRRWLLVDIDPQRPKDTSATNEQLAAALERARDVTRFLNGRGWPMPVAADSGNGLHLLYRVDLPNDDESAELVKHCLEALAKRFDDAVVKVDRSVFNAGRIIKLHGTVANKGDNVPVAPWRLSKLRAVPEDVQPVPLELLTQLAAEVRSQPAQPARDPSGGLRPWTETDVAAFLARGNIEHAGHEPHDGAMRWKLKECPFNPDHGTGESAVFLRPDGRLGFECRHNSCQDKHWRDIRELVDGPLQQRSRPNPSVGSVGGAQAHTERNSWPRPTSLPDGLPPVDAFDDELLPVALQEYVADISERMQCPPDFPAVALLTVLSSVVGRRIGIKPKRLDDWTVVPNLWGAVIGRPGIMKSPPLQEVMRPLQVLQVRAVQTYESETIDYQANTMLAGEAERVAKDTIRKLLKEGKNAEAAEHAEHAVRSVGQEPICKRYIVNDATVEKLGEILNQNPFGLLHFRDELTGFFRTLDRPGHEADRAFYLECWNGDGSHTYDRIGRGTLHVRGACLSILGGIQPGPLTDLVRGLHGSGDDGLLQRFQLAVWPDTSSSWRNIDRAPNLKARSRIEAIIQRLDSMARAEADDIPAFRFGDGAQALFDAWRTELETRLRDNSEHPTIEAHFAKYRSLIPSLALLIHLVEHETGPVERIALERAIAWGIYLESHARRIYSPAISPDVDAARALAEHIRKGQVGTTFSLRDIYNKGWSGLASRDDVAAAVRVLEDFDWLRSKQDDATGGRPRTAYELNPVVLDEVSHECA